MKTLDRKFWWIFTPFFILIIVILLFPYPFPFLSWFGQDISNESKISDSIGGITGLYIAIIAAFLTFFAFWVQYKANEQQKHDLQIERFESKFYNMVDIHRLNVSEIIIGGTSMKRKAFISMFNELKFIYLATVRFFSSDKQKEIIKSLTGTDSISDENTFSIAYLIFFFGIGPNSTKLILSLVDDRYTKILIDLEQILKDEQTTWNANKKIAIDEKTVDGDCIFTLDTRYEPFNGHMSRLSHYIRHLFQLVKFIDDQPDRILNYESKYNYAATVRAQLSAHEQLLLYYNALSALGRPWFDKDKDFIKKYCLVKSMPLPLADFYKKPLDILPLKNEKGKIMFEWIEIQDRMKSNERL